MRPVWRQPLAFIAMSVVALVVVMHIHERYIVPLRADIAPLPTDIFSTSISLPGFPSSAPCLDPSCDHPITVSSCGNGIMEPGEECEPAMEPCPGCCKSDCRLTQCSNGRDDDGDGNLAAGALIDTGGPCDDDIGCADCADCIDAGSETTCNPADDDETDTCPIDGMKVMDESGTVQVFTSGDLAYTPNTLRAEAGPPGPIWVDECRAIGGIPRGISVGPGRRWCNICDCPRGKRYAAEINKCVCMPTFIDVGGVCKCPPGAAVDATGKCVCMGGSVMNPATRACECPAMTRWDGRGCVCVGGARVDPDTRTCACIDGAVFDPARNTCMCERGKYFDEERDICTKPVCGTGDDSSIVHKCRNECGDGFGTTPDTNQEYCVSECVCRCRFSPGGGGRYGTGDAAMDTFDECWNNPGDFGCVSGDADCCRADAVEDNCPLVRDESGAIGGGQGVGGGGGFGGVGGFGGGPGGGGPDTTENGGGDDNGDGDNDDGIPGNEDDGGDEGNDISGEDEEDDGGPGGDDGGEEGGDDGGENGDIGDIVTFSSASSVSSGFSSRSIPPDDDDDGDGDNDDGDPGNEEDDGDGDNDDGIPGDEDDGDGDNDDGIPDNDDDSDDSSSSSSAGSIGSGISSGGGSSGGVSLASGASSGNGTSFSFGFSSGFSTSRSSGASLRSGASRTSQLSRASQIALATCGDGFINQSAEQCDDGNIRSGDGCSANCSREGTRGSRSSVGGGGATGGRTTGGAVGGVGGQDLFAGMTPQERLIAAAALCGDGKLDLGEECDDRNRRDDDGCSASCFLEIGICGDGIVQKLLGEQCEQASHNSALPYQCRNCLFHSLLCGDGKLDPGEECDDGPRNSVQPDAVCRPDCHAFRCGDAVLDSNELCDDGGRLGGDGCDRYCRAEKDGTTVAGERTVTLPQSQISSPQSLLAQFPFQQYPFYQQMPMQLPYGQLQPLLAAQPQTAQTGPAAIAVIGAGAAAGFGWMRRRRRR